MTLSYLVDTDWIIHYLNGNRKVVEKLGSLKDEGLSISIISLAELYEGINLDDFKMLDICKMITSPNFIEYCLHAHPRPYFLFVYLFQAMHDI